MSFKTWFCLSSNNKSNQEKIVWKKRKCKKESKSAFSNIHIQHNTRAKPRSKFYNKIKYVEKISKNICIPLNKILQSLYISQFSWKGIIWLQASQKMLYFTKKNLIFNMYIWQNRVWHLSAPRKFIYLHGMWKSGMNMTKFVQRLA